MGCFSFYPGKNLGACGEGGAVVTSNPDFDRKIRMLRDWGAERKYHHVLAGYNYRMEACKARSCGSSSRSPGKGWTEAGGHMRPGRLPAGRLWIPHFGRGILHPPRVPHLCDPEREPDRFQSSLHDRSVQTGIHYPIPVHDLQRAYADPQYGPGSFPHAEAAAREVLSLPMFPELTQVRQDEVAAALHRMAEELDLHDSPPPWTDPRRPTHLMQPRRSNAPPRPVRSRGTYRGGPTGAYVVTSVLGALREPSMSSL